MDHDRELQSERLARHLTPKTARIGGGSALVFVLLLGGGALWMDDRASASFKSFDDQCESIAPGTAAADIVDALSPERWVGGCRSDCGSFTGHDGLPYTFPCSGNDCTMAFDDGGERCTVRVGRNSLSALGRGEVDAGGF